MSAFKNSFSALALVSLMSSTALAADLDPVASPTPINEDNFYISLFGGANFGTDTDFENSVGTEVAVEFDTGFVFGGALGYKWKDYSFGSITPRTELEVNYFRNEVDELDFSGNGVSPDVLNGQNTLSGVGVFGNLFFDYDTGTAFTPYLGGGIGVAFTDINFQYGGAGANINDNDTSFAFQLGGGANYQVSDRISLFVDGRYTRILDVEGTRLLNNAFGGGSFEDDFSAIQVRSGISVSF